MSKTALVVLPSGAEEMEFVIVVDVLRRAGVSTIVAGLGDILIKCSRGVTIQADIAFEDAVKAEYDCIILPGGLGGAKVMAESLELGDLLRKFESDGKLIAAICAAPTVLLAHSIAIGKTITSYPAFKDQLAVKYNYVDDKIVVTDGNLITSRGPGTAFDFALKILETLVGIEKVKQVAEGMLYKLI